MMPSRIRLGAAHCLQPTLHQYRDARHPHAIVRRIRRFLQQGIHCPGEVEAPGCQGRPIRPIGLLKAAEISLLHGPQQILCAHHAGFGRSRHHRPHLIREQDILRIGAAGLLVSPAPYAQQMPPISEHAIVGPVGGNGAHCGDGDVVHQEHHRSENRQRRPSIGDDAVDSVGDGHPAFFLSGQALIYYGRNVLVPLIGDDALRVVLKGILQLLNLCGHVRDALHHHTNLVIPLQELDGEEALLSFRHAASQLLFHGFDGRLHVPGKFMHGGRRRFSLGCGYHLLHDRLQPCPFQSRDFCHLASQPLGQPIGMYPVSRFLHHIHHVHRHDHRDAQLRDLGGQIQVPLDIGAVHDIDDCVGPVINQIIPGHHLLKGVRRQGVYARQVHDDDLLLASGYKGFLQPPLLLLHRHPRPVAHELIGAGQCIE